MRPRSEDRQLSPPLRCDACGFEDPEVVPGTRCPKDWRVLVSVPARAEHPDDPVLGRWLGGSIAVYDVLSDAGGFATVYLGVQSPAGP